MSSQASFTSRHQTPAIGIACHSLRLDGGMGRYSLALVKGLNELNIEPVVFTKKIDENATANLRFKLELINCRWLPTKLRDYFYNYRVEKISKKYNLDGAELVEQDLSDILEPAFASVAERIRGI